MENALQSLMPTLTTYGVRVIGVLVLVWLGFKIARAIERAVTRSLGKADFDSTLTKFFGSLARYLVLLMVVLACLGMFGVETTSVAAVVGAAGLAVGLAFQGTLSNFAAGIMLLVFRPFNVGDIVHVADSSGMVVDISLFTVALDTLDNKRVIIPNSSIFGSVIENISHHPRLRVEVDVGVDYTADIDATKKVLEEALLGVPGRLSDEPVEAYLTGLGGSSVDWQARVYCDPHSYWVVRMEVIRAVKYALDGAGIGIPYPQMDVHLDGAVASAATGMAA